MFTAPPLWGPPFTGTGRYNRASGWQQPQRPQSPPANSPLLTVDFPLESQIRCLRPPSPPDNSATLKFALPTRGQTLLWLHARTVLPRGFPILVREFTAVLVNHACLCAIFSYVPCAGGVRDGAGGELRAGVLRAVHGGAGGAQRGRHQAALQGADELRGGRRDAQPGPHHARPHLHRRQRD
eukprot:2944761-Pyramimonas_sp.AAC.1